MEGAAAGRPDFVSLLLRDLMPGPPWVPPKSWEFIKSESGGRAGASTGVEPVLAPCDPLVVSEAVLVRLALNALQGVGSALNDIEKVSLAFCSSSADRTCHGIPNLWHRSSSMNTLGRLLKSVARAGLIFFLLRKFVDYFLGREQSIKVQYPRKGSAKRRQIGNGTAKNDAKQEEREIQKDGMGENPPFSIVNQAFAVAVGKILEGYLCSLNTVFASVKYRRSGKMMEKSAHISLNGGSFTSALSEITLLEVYLHTRELRTRIEVLGNICGLRTDNLAFSEFSGEGFAVKTNLEFDSFPRGADLLTYLYLHLRNADPIHHSLLEFLFVRSCEPYCHFIRSWIYKAKISDPYKEFVVECSGKFSCLYGMSTNFVKERDYTSVPCFLKHVSVPLLRAGQQLKVLIKLLDLCNSSVSEERSCSQVNVSCDLTSLEDVLPHWSDSLSDPIPCLSMLTFSNKDAEAMIKKRESVYKTMYSKLQVFFKGLDARCRPIKQTKWSAIEKSNVVAEIQRLLAVALQRSSCESDMYHERLYICPKGQGMVPSKLARLRLIEVYDIKRLQMRYAASLIGGPSMLATFVAVYALFGPTFPGIYDEDRGVYTLFYPGLSFAFPIPSQYSSCCHDREVATELPLEFPDGTTPVTCRVSIYDNSSDSKVGVGALMDKASAPLLPSGSLYMEELHVKLGEGIFFTVGGQHVAFGASPQVSHDHVVHGCQSERDDSKDRDPRIQDD